MAINNDIFLNYEFLLQSWKLWQQRDVGIFLLKEQQGFVAAWPRDFSLNDNYPKYYRKLLHYEAKFKNRASGLIEKLLKYVFK